MSRAASAALFAALVFATCHGHMNLESSTMRAAVLTRTLDPKAHPENIHIEQVPVPKPGPFEVLIKVLGSSVNPSDVDLIELPVGSRRMGLDVSGVVVSCGAGCGTRIQPGDEVFACNAVFGAWAEYTVSPCSGVAKKPKGLNFTEAGVLPEVAVTSLQNLQWAANRETKRLDNMTVVVLGGAGGTGHVGIQIAKALGAAEVITTCGPDHLDFVKSMGADRAINYHEEKWYNVLSDRSVDVVYDCVGHVGTGGLAFPKLKHGGHYATLLPFSLAGPKAKHQRPDVKQQFVPCTDCALHGRLEDMSRLVEAGLLRPHVEQVYELADVSGAVSHVMAGHTTGKVALVVQSPTQTVIV